MRRAFSLLLLFSVALFSTAHAQFISRDLPRHNPAFTGQLLAPSNNNGSSPDYSWKGDTDMGFLRFGADTMQWVSNGGRRFQWDAVNRFILRSDGTVNFTQSTSPSDTIDTIIARDAVGTLAQRNGTNAQSWRLYQTYTDAANYERIGLSWQGNAPHLLMEHAGTGLTRTFVIGTQGAAAVFLRTNGIDRVIFTAAGALRSVGNTFANLGGILTTNGEMIYCSDCTIANPCAGGGTGAIAKRLNGVNVCN